MLFSLFLSPPSPYHYICFDEASYHVGEVYVEIKLLANIHCGTKALGLKLLKN